MKGMLPDQFAVARGFTLVELVVILLILGILAVVALPRFGDQTSFESMGFYDNSINAVRFAQKVAIGQRQYVRLDLTATTLAACYCATPACGACGASVIDPSTGAALSLDALSAGVTLAPATNFFFDGLGKPDFAAPLVITVNGDSARSFTIEPETGYVHP